MSIGLVIPTIREDQIIEFLSAWKQQLIEANVKVYVVEDNQSKSFNLNIGDFDNVEHLTWDDAPKGMLDCINVKSPCCRQIGFWKAYNDGCEVIVTLDDDVRPTNDSNIFNQYYNTLMNGIPLWVDPLLNYRSRGYPVENAGKIHSVFHVGSFLAVPDVDGETQLKHENEFKENPPKYIPRATVIPKEQLIPVNGGICGWKREITPYLHYTSWCKELGYRRFDDIWMGIIMKRLLDHCNLNMSYGPPFVDHIRASVAEKNFEYEKEGRKWNEEFWEIFDKKISEVLEPSDSSLDHVYNKIASGLKDIDNLWAKMEGESMLKWREFFK